MARMADRTRTKRPRRSFTDEFKDGAVRLVLDEGKSISEVGRDLDVMQSVVGTWVKHARADRTKGKTGLESAIQDVGRDWLVVVAHRGALVPTPHASLQLLLLHQTNDPFAADVLAGGGQLRMHARTSIRAPALFVGFTHQHAEAPIITRVLRLRAPAPRVIAGARYSQSAAP